MLWMRWRTRWSIPVRSMLTSDYRLGALEYRSVRFETEVLDHSEFPGKCGSELYGPARRRGRGSLSTSGSSLEQDPGYENCYQPGVQLRVEAGG